MKKILVAMVFSALSFSVVAKENPVTANFVNEIKKAADDDKQLSETIVIECPAPSASGIFSITKATYDIGKSFGVYVFKNGSGPDASLNWISIKSLNDDFTSDVVTGMDFAFTMPRGQFFLTIMKNGKVKAGVSSNGKSSINEISCTASESQ